MKKFTNRSFFKLRRWLHSSSSPSITPLPEKILENKVEAMSQIPDAYKKYKPLFFVAITPVANKSAFNIELAKCYLDSMKSDTCFSYHKSKYQESAEDFKLGLITADIYGKNKGFTWEPIIDVFNDHDSDMSEVVLGTKWLSKYSVILDFEIDRLVVDRMHIQLVSDVEDFKYFEDFEAIIKFFKRPFIRSIQNILIGLRNSLPVSFRESESDAYGFIYSLQLSLNDLEVDAMLNIRDSFSFISKHFAEKCGLSDLIDYSEAETRNGQFLGKIHLVTLTAENDIELKTSLYVTDMNIDMSLGVDVLRRYKCLVNFGEDSIYSRVLKREMFLNLE